MKWQLPMGKYLVNTKGFIHKGLNQLSFKRKVQLVVSVVFFIASPELAMADGKTSGSLKGSQKKAPSGLDAEISNAKLRAESGSVSNWSMSSVFTYLGSSLKTPFDKDLPNVTGAPVSPRVQMSGDLAVRYRINKNASLRFGSGFSIVRPFHGAESSEVNNPLLGYGSTYRVFDLQMSSTIVLSITTDSDYRAIGDVGTISFSQTILAPVFLNSWSVGTSLSLFYTKFDRSGEFLMGQSGNSDFAIENYQIELGMGITPFVEYQISSKIGLRSSLSALSFSHFRNQSPQSYKKGKVHQTLGLGISASRDVYLFPYIAFVPGHASSENSTVNVSAIVNVF